MMEFIQVIYFIVIHVTFVYQAYRSFYRMSTINIKVLTHSFRKDWRMNGPISVFVTPKHHSSHNIIFEEVPTIRFKCQLKYQTYNLTLIIPDTLDATHERLQISNLTKLSVMGFSVFCHYISIMLGQDKIIYWCYVAQKWITAIHPVFCNVKNCAFQTDNNTCKFDKIAKDIYLYTC